MSGFSFFKNKFKFGILEKFFSSDMFIKLLALGLSIILWIFINDELNPITTIEVNVPLVFKNENIINDNSYTVVNKNVPKYISVVVKGRKKKLQGLTQENLEAAINFEKTNLSGKVQKMPVEVILDKIKIEDGISIDNFSPNFVDIEFERIGKNSFKPVVELKGEPKTGYIVVNSTAIPDNISLQGGATFFNSVGSVKVVVDINGINKDSIFEGEGHVYDKFGKEIQGATKYPGIKVKVDVAKEVPVVPVVAGKPSKDFIEISRVSTPLKVKIRGNEEVLDKIYDLRTETIQIDGIAENITRNVKLTIPDNIQLVDKVDNVEIKINLDRKTIKKAELLNNKIKIIGSKPNMTYSFASEKTEMEVIGAKNELDKFDINLINAKIDVSNIEEGNSFVKILFDLPNGLQLQNEYTAQLITKKN